jgi:hypothetical protein
MTQPPLRIAGAFRAVGYLVLTYVGIQSLFDLASAMAPVLPELVAWRIRAEGLTAGGWSTPALMVLLLCFLAFALEDRKVLWTLCAVAAIGALLLIVTSGLFALDAIQMNRSVPASGKKPYAISAAYAMGKLGFGVLSFALLSWACSKAARTLRKASAVGSSRQAVLVGAAAIPAGDHLSR